MGKSRRRWLPVVPALNLKLCSGLKGCTWCGAWNQELVAVGQADNLSCFFTIPRSVDMWIASDLCFVFARMCKRGCELVVDKRKARFGFVSSSRA